jgi:hypothetical protein
MGSNLGAQVFDMYVGSQSYVVGKVSAGVVGIFVNDNVIGVPEPVVAVADVIGSDAKVESAEPETVGAASGEPRYVAPAETSGEVAMFSGMVEVIVRIVGAAVVADPLAIGVDVRGIGMARLVVIVTGFLGGCGMGYAGGGWAVGGDVLGSATDFVTLRECHN